MAEWTEQSFWKGNPELGYESWEKYFLNPYTQKKTLVQVFGKPRELGSVSYSVSAGANSDWSHTGCFYPEKLSFAEAMERVDRLYDDGILFR